MRKAALAMALVLMSGTAIAQTTSPDLDVDADVGVQADGDLDVDADVDVEPMATHSGMMMEPASGHLVQPGNQAPERDARGIAVLSDPAFVPSGWNGVASGSTGMGGPLVDPATGATVDAADDSYPACSRTVTDNCVQTYERGRR